MVFYIVAGLLRIEAKLARGGRDRTGNAAGAGNPARDGVARADGGAYRFAEGLIGCRSQRDSQSSADAAVWRACAVEQHIERQALEKLRLLGLFKYGKARRNIRFEWKPVQELRAECVNCLHFKATRGFEGSGEQPSRQRAPRRIGFDVRARPDCLLERGVVEHRPFAERVEHPLRHIGGGGLGEGDAKDFFRLHACKEKIDHALRQNMGLTRSGIGSHPSGRLGIRDRTLQRADLERDDLRPPHSAPGISSMTPPELDHSLTRAR